MMALRRHEAMFLAVRIEMAACGIEGRIAFPDRMDMKGMLAGRQAASIARTLKRTEGATRQKAFSLGLSLNSRS
jgi:hypothetical protein